MHDKILKFVTVLSNIQSYFIFCLFYFLILELRNAKLNIIGEVIFNIMFNILMPFFIIVPLLFYAILKKTDFKKRYVFIFIALITTIIMFEFILTVRTDL